MPSAWSWYQDRGRALGVRVLERRGALGPRRRRTSKPPCSRRSRTRCPLWRSLGDVVRVGQVPRLGVAIALVADARRPVHVGHDGYGPGVAAGRRLERGPHVPLLGPPGGFAQWSVGSTGSRCGRKSPSSSTRSLIHFTRTGRFHLASIVSEGALWRSSPRLFAERTAPYPQTRRGHRRGKDLLGELPHRDLVGVDGLASGPRDPVGPRHHRGDQQGRDESRDSRWAPGCLRGWRRWRAGSTPCVWPRTTRRSSRP